MSLPIRALLPALLLLVAVVAAAQPPFPEMNRAETEGVRAYAAQPDTAADGEADLNTPGGLPDGEELKARIQALNSSPDLSEAERNEAQSLYQQALDNLQAAERFAESRRRFRRALSAAPEETARLEQQLVTEAESVVGEPVTPDIPVKDIENRLAAAQSKLNNLQSQLADLDNKLEQLRSRPEQARSELADARLKLSELERRLGASATGTIAPQLAAARTIANASQREALQQQAAMLEQELLSHDARVNLRQAQRAVLQQQIGQADAQVQKLLDLLNERRRQEAAKAVQQTEQASQQAADRPPVIQQAAATNAEFSQQLAELAKQIDETGRLKQDVNQKLNELQQRFNSIRQQLEIAGYSDALSSVLRSERYQLPDLEQYQKGAKKRQDEIVQARLQQFQIDQQRRQLDALDEQLKQLLAQTDLPAERLTAVRNDLRQLLEDRRQLLDQLSRSYSSYTSQLTELDQAQRQLVDSAQQYAELLDQKLFWIASGSPVDLQWLGKVENSLPWLLDAGNWRSVGRGLEDGLRARPGIALATLVVWLVLLGYRRALKRRLRVMAGDVGKVQRDSFLLTLETLLITLLLALPWPLLLGVWGALLSGVGEATEFAQGVGRGLTAVGAFLLVTDLLRQLCRPHGVGPVHFRWTQQTCGVLVHGLLWFQPLGAVSTLVLMMTERLSDELYRDTLGRVAFVFGSLLFSLFLARILSPRWGALGGFLKHRTGLGWRLRVLWYPLSVILPLAMGSLALVGYQYTAMQMQSRLFMSGCLLVFAVVVVYLVLRWLNLTRRRLAFAQVRARREAILAARASKDTTTGDAGHDQPEVEEIDLDSLGDQARALFKLAAFLGIGAGFWLIWFDLLPALTFLNQVTLWQHEVTTEAGPKLNSITLGSVLLALALLGLLLIIARNLPGLLEIILLQRLGIDAGTRYAVATITRYLITSVALIATLSIIGIKWDDAQWLVAALGVGLGFGLQEIFANFVSGIILLLERPVRVGDTITIDNRTGTVSRIRIRATTITDWDNMEIVIPNKTFITGTLINWTLTDPITRVIIPIRVGFNADLERTRDILMEATRSHPLVLKDPEPMVLLLQLGESSLTFEVRAFVRDLMDRLTITNDLYMRVIKTLHEQGIDVPFPQRDLHIRTVPPLEPPVESESQLETNR